MFISYISAVRISYIGTTFVINLKQNHTFRNLINLLFITEKPASKPNNSGCRMCYQIAVIIEIRLCHQHILRNFDKMTETNIIMLLLRVSGSKS
jgi:hypothetical protein